MTKKLIDEGTLKLALKALQEVYFGSRSAKHDEAITALREALAEQPAQQEPFGYFKAEPFGWTDCAETDEGAVALYTTPQPTQRKPLTDEQILEILCIYLDEDDDIEEWRHEINEARAIEAAHGIKENT